MDNKCTALQRYGLTPPTPSDFLLHVERWRMTLEFRKRVREFVQPFKRRAYGVVEDHLYMKSALSLINRTNG